MEIQLGKLQKKVRWMNSYGGDKNVSTQRFVLFCFTIPQLLKETFL